MDFCREYKSTYPYGLNEKRKDDGSTVGGMGVPIKPIKVGSDKEAYAVLKSMTFVYILDR